MELHMYHTKLKAAAVAVSVLFSASAFSQSLHCNGDARILSSGGLGSSGNINGSANGNNANGNAQVGGNSAGNINSADANVSVYDGLDRQSCYGDVVAQLNDANTGALIQSVRVVVNDRVCRIILQGQINMRESRRVRNGDCNLNNRGRQITYGGVTYALSGFVYRDAQ